MTRKRRTNGRSHNYHVNRLMLSLADDISLAGAVEDRFLDLCGAWLRVRGVELSIPKSLNADILRWRQMRVRHKSGDFRHTSAELASVKTIAQWTVDMNSELRGQKATKIEWGD